MKKIFSIKWFVLLLGLIGLALVFVAQNGNLIAQFSGATVVALAIIYFVRFERDTVNRLTKQIYLRVLDTKTFGAFLYRFRNRVITIFTEAFDISRAYEKEVKTGKSRIYVIGLLLILIMSGFLLSYNLGGRDLRGDEFQVVSAATGYLNTGEFYRWNWIDEEPVCEENTKECTYDRAWPHTMLISGAYKIFGISEWSSRIVSVVFILLLVLISYFFVWFFTKNKMIALVSSFTIALTPSYIQLGQYTRMYALLAPLFLIVTYLFYKGITGTINISVTKSKIHKFIYDNFNFNYPYLLLAFLVLYPTYIIHINSLVLLPAVFLFVIYMAISNKEKKYTVLSLLGLIGIIASINLSFVTTALDQVTNFLSFFDRNNVVYLEYLTKFPLPGKGGIVFLLFGAISLIFTRSKTARDKLVYLYIIVFFSLFFFTYIADRYASFVYISHIVPIAIFLIINTYFIIVRSAKTTILKTLLVLLFATLLWYNSYGDIKSIYQRTNHSDFIAAYDVIVDNYKPEKEVIFGQYLRGYYLKDLGNDTETISMLNKKLYSYDMFVQDIQKHESGWLVWETRKRYHIKKDIINYVDENFQKLSGRGVNETRIEMYYFNKDMLTDFYDTEN